MRPELKEEYRTILQAYRDGAGEEASLQAYDFARRCLREGLAPDDVVALHVEMVEGEGSPSPRDLLLDVVVAFSMAYQQTTRQLETANEELGSLSNFKSRMLSMVAHDMMNHVVATRMVLTSLRRDAANPGLAPRFDSLLQIVDDQEHLIQNLLDLGRIESGRLHMATERIDLTRLIERAILKAQSGTPRHTLTVQGPAVQVMGDRSKLQQVLDNLLGNAVKYSPQGGTIEVSVAVSGSLATVSIHDHGLGIPPEDLPHLFEPFYRGASEQSDIRGTGLGLTIVNSLVRMHQGTLSVDSTPGEGSSFSFTLPVAEGT